MRDDISLLRAHAEDWIRVMQLAHPMISTINRLSAEGQNLRWVHSLERGCVANWGALIATPDLVTQSKVQRALSESSCPSCLTVKLVGNAHVSKWPPGLSTLEVRRANRRYCESYQCRKIPGEQAIVIMAVDNSHMNGNMVLEPGLLIIFSYGIDVPNQP